MTENPDRQEGASVAFRSACDSVHVLSGRHGSFVFSELCFSGLVLFCSLTVFVFASHPSVRAAAIQFEQKEQVDPYGTSRQLFFSGKYNDCLKLVEKAIGDGNVAERWFLLQIDCLMATGQYDKARLALNEAMQANPGGIRILWSGYNVLKHNNDIQSARKLLTALDDKVYQRRWRYRDAWNLVAQGRFHLLLRTDAKEILDKYLTPASLREPDDSIAYLAIGDLALAKHDYAMAATNFKKATEVDPQNPAGYLGLAYAWQPSDLEKASAAIQKTMELNPNYLPGLHYLIDDRLSAENYESANQLIEQALKINSKDPTLWAYRSFLAHVQNDPDTERQAREKALAVYEGNPEVDFLIGKKLSQRYRFAEGARMQRRSLTYDSDYLPAKIQLANDLLRLGDADEGWKLADEVYREDGYNVVAYNLVTLGNTVADYRVLQRDGFVVRMEPDEADLYGDLVLDLLSDAKKELCEKYDAKVAEPVFVEIFPRQQDFAIRTFGLPGGAGYLGVCFGRVITMNSPKSQSRLNSNWKSVLWHEYCHVVTLQKTANRMPRWLSEGISVYEERLKDPAWGQVMTPAYREMILGGKLTPVSQLSSAFVSPDSGQALQFAYYQSSLVVDYLVEQYGAETLNQILADLRLGIPINEVLCRYTGGVKLLDKEFAEYAEKRARLLAAMGDLEKPALPPRATIQQWQQWHKENPTNIYGIKSLAAILIQESRLDEAEALVEKLIEIFPEDRSDENGHYLMAVIARQREDGKAELANLVRSTQLQAATVSAFQRAAELAVNQKDWAQARQQAERWLAVNPLVPAPHRLMAEAAEATGDLTVAIQSLKALTLLDPFDPAEAYFRYARALAETGQDELAKRQVLKCLEQAPRYRQAHQLLLKLARKSKPPPESSNVQAKSKLAEKEAADRDP